MTTVYVNLGSRQVTGKTMAQTSLFVIHRFPHGARTELSRAVVDERAASLQRAGGAKQPGRWTYL